MIYKKRSIRREYSVRKSRVRKLNFDSKIQIFIIDLKKTFFKNKISVFIDFNNTIGDLKQLIKEKMCNQNKETIKVYIREKKDDLPSDIILRGKQFVNISDLKTYSLIFGSQQLIVDNK